MKIILLLLVNVLLTTQSLIGYNIIPDKSLNTLRKNDPSFQLTFQNINNLLNAQCQINLLTVLSVNYQIVGGIKYVIIFDTKYGQLNVTALTQYWLNSVKILSINFIQPQNLTSSANSAKFNTQPNNTGIFVSASASTAATTSKPTNQVQIEISKFIKDQNHSDSQFPELRKKCNAMKNQNNKIQSEPNLRSSIVRTSTQMTSDKSTTQKPT